MLVVLIFSACDINPLPYPECSENRDCNSSEVCINGVCQLEVFQNEAPTVNAGSDFSVLVHEETNLQGVVSDDGLPNAVLISSWSVVSGSDVVFEDKNNPNSGVIFDSVGIYTLKLNVDDGELSSSDDVIITVTQSSLPPDEKPFIIVQPSSVSVDEGNTATFTVQAESYDQLAYHWWIGSTQVVDVPNKIEGALTNQLRIYDVHESDAVSYVVEVYNPKIYSSAESWENSQTVTLTVNGVVADPVCGNNKLEQGEQCDDGNKESGDGCSSTCQTESDFEGDCLRTFYVSNSQGNDNNNGLSEGSAIKSLVKLQTMLDNSQPGDCYFLKRGDTWTQRAGVSTAYAGLVGLDLTKVDGSSSNWITIGAYGSGNLPTFDFSGTGSSIFFEGANYLLVKDLRITSTNADLSNRPTVGIHSVGSLGGGFHFVTFDGVDVDGVVQPARIQEFDSSEGFILQNSMLRNGANEEGMTAYDSNSNGIFLTVPNSKLLNNKIYNNGHQDSQLYLMNSLNLVVEGNEIYNGEYGFHISNPENVIVRNNKIYDTDYVGIYLGTRNYGAFLYAKNVTIEGNEIYNTPYGILIDSDTFPDIPPIQDILIKNNVVHDCSASAVRMYTMRDMENINFYNNVFYNNLDAIDVHNNLNILSMSFKNNIFYNDKYSDGNLIRVQNNAFSSKMTFDNNLYYNTVGNVFNIGGDMWAYVDGNIYDFSQFKSAYPSKEQHGVFGNPLFVNANAKNFHLQSGSPAINTGANVGVTKDFDDVSRPQGSGYDIGAFEYK